MISANRPIINLDLDLLRTFVAVADLNTFAAAAAAVCRTQSAVSQQMQRLEQLVGKELFARHGRNKLLTEHGIQHPCLARNPILDAVSLPHQTNQGIRHRFTY